MVHNEPTCEDWLAAIRAFRRLGIAMAAMMRIMVTTIRSSISEKPFCLRIYVSSFLFQLWSWGVDSVLIRAIQYPKNTKSTNRINNMKPQYLEENTGMNFH